MIKEPKTRDEKILCILHRAHDFLSNKRNWVQGAYIRPNYSHNEEHIQACAIGAVRHFGHKLAPKKSSNSKQYEAWIEAENLIRSAEMELQIESPKPGRIQEVNDGLIRPLAHWRVMKSYKRAIQKVARRVAAQERHK